MSDGVLLHFVQHHDNLLASWREVLKLCIFSNSYLQKFLHENFIRREI